VIIPYRLTVKKIFSLSQWTLWIMRKWS